MEEQHININYTARYYTLGERTNDPQQEVWIVLHGYGQLARYFIKKFEPLSQENAFVIAPEGLSLFYLQGTKGRVGATWMTREFREQAIHNYTTYLLQIYHELQLQNKQVVLFSFSQGGATLIRWATHHRISFRKMIVWAGGFPPDVDPIACKEIFSGKQLFYVYGSDDEYITPERLAKQKMLFRQFHFYPEVIRFEGTHRIDPAILHQLQQKEPFSSERL